MNEQWQDPSIDDLEPPMWPKVVGITSISWATLSLGCGICGMGMMLMPMIFQSEMQQQFPDGIPPTLAHPPVAFYLLAAIGIVVNLLLFASGILLLLRKPVARLSHLAYAVAAIIISIGSVWFNLQFQAELNQWNIDNPSTAWAQQQAAAPQWSQHIGLAFGIFLGFVWPTFCLIWFGAVKKDAQEIARGVEMLV